MIINNLFRFWLCFSSIDLFLFIINPRIISVMLFVSEKRRKKSSRLAMRIWWELTRRKRRWELTREKSWKKWTENVQRLWKTMSRFYGLNRLTRWPLNRWTTMALKCVLLSKHTHIFFRWNFIVLNFDLDLRPSICMIHIVRHPLCIPAPINGDRKDPCTKHLTGKIWQQTS